MYIFETTCCKFQEIGPCHMGMEQKMMIALVVAHHSLIFWKGASIINIENVSTNEFHNENHTLRSVDDVTEGITQERPMGDS